MAVDNSMDGRVCFASRLAACFWRRAAMSCAVCAAPVAAASSAVSRSTSRANAPPRTETPHGPRWLAKPPPRVACGAARARAPPSGAPSPLAAEGGCGAGGVEMTSSGAAGGSLGARVDSTRSGVGVWRERRLGTSMRRSRCMDAKLAACEASSAASRLAPAVLVGALGHSVPMRLHAPQSLVEPRACAPARSYLRGGRRDTGDTGGARVFLPLVQQRRGAARRRRDAIQRLRAASPRARVRGLRRGL